MTQKETLDAVLGELRHIKQHMPNGELKQMQKDMEDLKEDISDLKYTLLNPDNGVIVNTNKNTEFRQGMQANEKDFQEQMLKIKEIENWKGGVTRALWIIFGIIASIIIRMFMMHSETGG
jgi:predicted  nucleic acid-binding Zn-ribbon protein